MSNLEYELRFIRRFIESYSINMDSTILFSLVLKMYLIFIVKEFVCERLWENYKTFKGSILTTLFLLIMPISSIAIISREIYLMIKNRKIGGVLK